MDPSYTSSRVESSTKSRQVLEIPWRCVPSLFHGIKNLNELTDCERMGTAFRSGKYWILTGVPSVLSQGVVSVMNRQLSQENVVWIGVCAGYLLAIATKDEKSVALRLDKDTLQVVKRIALQKVVRLPNSE